MADKKKTVFAAPQSKNVKAKRPSTTLPKNKESVMSSRKDPPAAAKDRFLKPKSAKNISSMSMVDAADMTISDNSSFDEEHKQISYCRFLRSMLKDCLVNEKIERETTEIDVQMAQLAARFEKSVDLLEKTHRRIKDISFITEQKRLLDLKNKDCSQFYELNKCNPESLLEDLYKKEQNALDRLETRNVDFGYDSTSGHQQLLEALNEAVDGLEEIKKQSDIDIGKFKEYEKLKKNMESIEEDSFELDKLKNEFDSKFPDFSNELSRQLDVWLSKADLTHGPARAIIAPHAGYSYCGACAAFAYRQVSPVVVKRIFILGPSHHVRLCGCALSSMDKYRTPLYDLTIDKQIYAELEATKQFEWMDTQTDEDEHSIEMHLPYIAKVMEEYKSGFTIIPILVGSLSPEKEAKYGSILAPYLADPQNLVVISSDFCHWGSRFRYTWRDSSRGKIYQSIEWLDRQGMDIIEKMDPRAFTDYLNKYGNTICGRHPIGVLLQVMKSDYSVL
ncbi:Protein MEMO1 [Eumeta japonica]|uniref:Protein MEMO1 n=1 Tax=Eumeta variegata TaxID=151549 RepID=A0A4C1VRV6_EUMVA|nr:Protein MEMO1 [Eumeta japonica]